MFLNDSKRLYKVNVKSLSKNNNTIKKIIRRLEKPTSIESKVFTFEKADVENKVKRVLMGFY